MADAVLVHDPSGNIVLATTAAKRARPLEVLLGRADALMYEQKRLRKNGSAPAP